MPVSIEPKLLFPHRVHIDDEQTTLDSECPLHHRGHRQSIWLTTKGCPRRFLARGEAVTNSQMPLRATFSRQLEENFPSALICRLPYLLTLGMNHLKRTVTRLKHLFTWLFLLRIRRWHATSSACFPISNISAWTLPEAKYLFVPNSTVVISCLIPPKLSFTLGWARRPWMTFLGLKTI